MYKYKVRRKLRRKKRRGVIAITPVVESDSVDKLSNDGEISDTISLVEIDFLLL